MQSYQEKINRYCRTKKITVKHIQSDDSQSEIVTYEEKESVVSDPNICLQDVEHYHDESQRKTVRKRRKKVKQSKFKVQEMELTLNKWSSFEKQKLPDECLSILKEHKKDSAEDIRFSLQYLLKRSFSKKILFIHGQPSTGKKTLLFNTLQEMKKEFTQSFKSYFIDFEGLTRQQSEEEILKLHQYLLSKTELKSQPVRQFLDIFIINTFHSFYFFIKKVNLMHQMKKCLLISNSIFIFVDKYQFKTRKESWLQEHAKTIKVQPNSLNFLASSLTTYVNNYAWKTISWNINQSLSMYFSSKLMNQGQKNIHFIKQIVKFLEKDNSKLQQKVEEICKERKVTREILQQFKEMFSRVSNEVNISKLSIHEKLILISCFISLTEQEQVRIPLSDLGKLYKWACLSLSIQPRSHQQLYKVLLPQMQTYKLIKMTLQHSKSIPLSVVLLIQTQKIKTEYEADGFLSKFFQIKNEQENSE